jgi:hypothetical protein
VLCLLAGVLGLASLASLAFAGPARAGAWMQVSCVNPDGSAATADGWSGAASGSLSLNSTNDPTCGPGHPMQAYVLASQASGSGTENLTYTPPSGSTLAGGSLQVSLSADGHSSASPNNASGAAGVLAPQPGWQPSDELTACAYWSAGCWRADNSAFQAQPDWSGTVTVPSYVGGTLTLSAACLALPSGGQCSTNANPGTATYAYVAMSRADLLLDNTAAPQGADFSGSALQPGVGGVAHLVFTATDPGGPGVYTVAAAIDGQTVSSVTPNTNNGHCVPVGTDPVSGALMFDWQQPCPVTQVIDLAVPTAGLSDGAHELGVTVTDAAGNHSTVFDQMISTHNPSLTPVPRSRRSVKAQFVLSWQWSGRRTRLRGVTARRLPRGGQIRIACAGHGCPRLRPHVIPVRRWTRLRRALDGRTFTSGDRLFITVTARGRRAERILVGFNSGARPSARLR